MLRDFIGGFNRAAGLENKKTDLGIRSVVRFRERFGSKPFGLAHPGLNPIHRGRSRPGWQNRLF